MWVTWASYQEKSLWRSVAGVHPHQPVTTARPPGVHVLQLLQGTCHVGLIKCSEHGAETGRCILLPSHSGHGGGSEPGDCVPPAASAGGPGSCLRSTGTSPGTL